MIDSLYLAWRYVAYHKVKTGILVVSLTLMIYLPVALHLVITNSERQLMLRSASTPLIVGAKGSSLDLTIGTLYFELKQMETIGMDQAQRVEDSGLALAIPLYTRFRAREHTIVGTTLDYFAFRNLTIARGRQMTRLGECVLGASAAQRLGLEPGDDVLSSPESLFDLAGTYPLKMKVTGILDRSYSPDDEAVFVDLKTVWIIQGLGHGHQDLQTLDDPDVLLRAEGKTLTANAKLLQYNEITDANIDTFHFHGNMSDYPITAVIAIGPDKKSEDILRGRFQSTTETAQIIRPIETIERLTDTIFKVEGILHSAFALVSLATLLLIVLVMMLSVRLRSREIFTMFKLGCSRLKIASMLASELGITLVMSISLALILAAITSHYADEILRALIL